jgi:hypothetical protein
MHIVMDEAPERVQSRLARTCRMLKQHHQIDINRWRLNPQKNGIEALPSPRTDDEGRAFAGSQRQIQLYVNRYADKLNTAIIEQNDRHC